MELYNRRVKQGNQPSYARSCSLMPNQGEAHDAPWDAVAPCSECHRSYCHKHALLFRRSHVSDGILDIKDVKRIYHPRHTAPGRKADDDPPRNDKEVFNAAFGSSYGLPKSRKAVTLPEAISELGPGTRLTWAAITYPDCSPIDRRSQLGFYDNKVGAVWEDCMP